MTNVDSSPQQSLRVVFAGTPDFAVPTLAALVASPHQVLAVYTQPDRPAGRGRRLTAGPVKQFALDYNETASPPIDIRQPRTLKKEAVQAELAALEPDLLVVAAYGLILPQAVLDVPRLGCWNVHASLLPRWRGAAPIHRALLAGNAETGICIMEMEKGLDTGPVWASEATPIRPDDTGGSLHDRLASIGGALLVKTLAQRATLAPVPQDDTLANYADKLSKAEADLDLRRPAVELDRQIRAFNPWPVARVSLEGQWLRVWAAELRPALSGIPGEVLASGSDGIDVACGAAGLRLTRLQRPGGKPLPAGDFLNAFALPPGTRFDCAKD
ncbi:MAG: methionyl-tRNA formyltransferase [Pseudomonadota bacterium]